jgi:hypothetical protein
MLFFERYFKEYDFDATNSSGEIAVNCPFPHYSGSVQYFETVPSAHINTEKSLFHCKVCGAKHSEPSFMKDMLGIEYPAAIKLLKHIEQKALNTKWATAQHEMKTVATAKQLQAKLHITDAVRDELLLGHEGEGISFPVHVFGQIVDIRKYNPNQKPKVRSRIGANAGYFIPDVAKMIDQDEVLICAGEKDMALARSLGLEAYTITGGENKLPDLFGFAFRNTKVYIMYDNDDAGIQGAKKLGAFVVRHGGTPHLVFGHHKVATEKGEDLFDYIVKYEKTKEDLLELIYSTKEMSEEEIQQENEKHFPKVLLDQSVKPEYRHQYVTSLVQVTGTYNNTFGIPNVIEFEKVAESEKAQYNKLGLGYKGLYTVDHDNTEDILYLMDSGLKETQVDSNIRTLCKVPAKEEGIVFRTLSYATVHKSSVVNHNLYGEDAKPVEIDVYSFVPMENGKKYRIVYKVVEHPLRQQELVLIADQVIAMENDLEEFKITADVKNSLKVFQVQKEETVAQAMDRLFEYDKGYIGAEANKDIAQTIDLVYHSPLDIKVGRQMVRGALDVFMVGATRTGKSKTSKIKQQIYNLGSVINLGTTTVPGLIGGTNKATNRTKIGLLPREHKNLVILEEFSSMQDNDFIKAMTDIRSSNEVRIVRVDSDIRVPCKLRMLTISNPKSRTGGAGKSMSSYPNGIAIILELIDSPEDIARYDFFTLVPEPEEYASFLDCEYEKVPEVHYQNRVRWLWTRKPDDIIMSPQVQKYVWEQSVELNKDFNTHVKIVGTEAWLKLVRVAVAAAGMLASTDASCEKLIVTKDHIDWAMSFFYRLYDNETFKLKQFVEEERKYTEVDETLIIELQELYAKNSTMLSFLENTNGVTRPTLRDLAGMANEEFSIVLNDMARLYLFKWAGNSLVPSERFRKGMQKINRNIKVERGKSVV